MLMTLLLVLAQFVVLGLLGAALLAPAEPALRRVLLPVAPVLGAVLIAVVTNWTCRWLPVREGLLVVAVVAAAVLRHGVRRGRVRIRWTGQVVRNVSLVLVACAGGLAFAAAPVAHVGDHDVVAPAYVVDGFYFSGVSSYLVDHPVLPGPVMERSWTGNDAPATAPAADTVRNRLRFGQSAVAAALSVLVLQPPYATVVSVSLLWLLLLGLSVHTAGRLLGLGARSALVAAAVVSSSFFVVSQSLEGKNDGLLGSSLSLVAVALSSRVATDRHARWLLVLVAGGLVATYSEYLTLLAPVLGGIALLGPGTGFRIGPWSGLRHRLDVIGGCWAATALIVPWAWVWLAQSFKITPRNTDGPTPFLGKSGAALFRAYLGVGTLPGGPVVQFLLTAAGIALVALVLGCWAVVLRRDPARGGLAGLLLVTGGFEVFATLTGSGNLQYRVLQLGLPLLVVFAVLGAQTWVRDERPARGRRAARPTGRARPAVALISAGVFVTTNLATVGLSTSFARAEVQHVPAAFLAAVQARVRAVGADRVSVVTPLLTDSSAFSLGLLDFPGVDFPALVPSPVYLGAFPHWNGEADDYYVIGPGAVVLGEADYLHRDGRYAIVRLGPSGMVLAPFLDGWARPTWMRGSWCARPGVKMLVLRGSTEPATLEIGVRSRDSSAGVLQVTDGHGDPWPLEEGPRAAHGWTVSRFEVPATRTAVVSLDPALRTAAFPVAFPQATGPYAGAAAARDSARTRACLHDPDSGTDGYDRELTLMRTGR